VGREIHPRSLGLGSRHFAGIVPIAATDDADIAARVQSLSEPANHRLRRPITESGA
jgi:hypothetical protein